MLVDFIAMGLVNPFDTTSKGNKYALTITHVLSNYVFCIPTTDKTADLTVDTYLKEIYCQFCESHKILSDNGSELKNKLLAEAASQLGIKHIFSSLYML